MPIPAFPPFIPPSSGPGDRRPDAQANSWVTPAGRAAVLVGDSSRDIDLRGTLRIRR